MFKTRNLLMLLLTVSLAACSLPGSPVAQPTADVASTLDAVRTQAAETVAADIASRVTATTPPTATLAATATEIPSPTTAPSFTPVNTLPPLPTATNTFIPATATITLTPTPTNFNCTVTAVSPKANTEFAKRADFDGRWTVKNTGTQDWVSSDVDYRYLSGQKMHVGNDVFDFKSNLKSGDSIDIIVDMLAPDSTGTFTATWGVVRNSQTLCQLKCHHCGEVTHSHSS